MREGHHLHVFVKQHSSSLLPGPSPAWIIIEPHLPYKTGLDVMLCKVTHCAGRVSANTSFGAPQIHQLSIGHWQVTFHQQQLARTITISSPPHGDGIYLVSFPGPPTVQFLITWPLHFAYCSWKQSKTGQWEGQNGPQVVAQLTIGLGSTGQLFTRGDF